MDMFEGSYIRLEGRDLEAESKYGCRCGGKGCPRLARVVQGNSNRIKLSITKKEEQDMMRTQRRGADVTFVSFDDPFPIPGV